MKFLSCTVQRALQRL